VRAGSASETQSVGRDVAGRVLAERALAEARDQAETASRAKSPSWPWCRMKSARR
jgi:hypothetical protein